MKIARASLALLPGAAATTAAGAQQRTLRLAGGGTTAYSIVVRPGATAAERFAATALASYYRILVRRDALVLAGASGRAVLFAVYDLLARPMLEEVLEFLAANRERGVFMVRDGDRARYMRLFGVPTSD